MDAQLGTAAQRYAQGMIERTSFLDRARRNSLLTIPYLFREEGASGSQDTPVPWDSTGAYMVSNLASKVLLALFPPGRPPMKIKQSRKALAELAEIEDPEARSALKSEIDRGLSLVESEFVDAFEEDGDRARLGMASLKLIVGGNHALHFYPDGTIRDLSLDKYVTWRDRSGALLEFVIKDVMPFETLAPDIKSLAVAQGFIHNPQDPSKNVIDVYTRGVLRSDSYEVCQEIMGSKVPSTIAQYKPDRLPYLFLVWTMLDGENYGRSYVELYEGDLQTVDGTTQTVCEGSAAIARYIVLVSPTGLTNKKSVAQASNGDVITGRAEDVQTLVSNKSGDFAAANLVIDKAQSRLARAFLLNSAVQRNGDRVTAEEIRFLAQELEDALGGVYSQQVVSWQSPFIRRKLHYLQKASRVTSLPKEATQITIIAGIAALGRNAELSALDSFLGGSIQLFGPEQVFKSLSANALREYLRRRAAALGISTEGLIPTEEEAEAMAEQQQQQQMLEQFGPNALSQIGQNITATTTAQIAADSRVQASESRDVEKTRIQTPILEQ